MKGRADHEAAAVEAREEAGVVGKVHRGAIGKRLADQFRLIEVDVYPFEVSHQLEEWRERQSRQMAWLPLEDAATLVAEPALITLIRQFGCESRNSLEGWRGLRSLAAADKGRSPL